MPPDNPYSAPETKVEMPAPPPGPARWWRIPLWGFLLFVVVVLVHAVGSALLMIWAMTMQDAATIATIRNTLLNLAASVAAFFLYLAFLHGTGRRHFLQILCVFAFLQLMDIPLALLMRQPLEKITSVGALSWNLAVCLVAYGAWHFYSRRRARPQARA